MLWAKCGALELISKLHDTSAGFLFTLARALQFPRVTIGDAAEKLPNFSLKLRTYQNEQESTQMKALTAVDVLIGLKKCMITRLTFPPSIANQNSFLCIYIYTNATIYVARDKMQQNEIERLMWFLNSPQ